MKYTEKLEKAMLKSNTAYSKGDSARIAENLAKVGVIVSASLVSKVIRGERRNLKLQKFIIRYYQLKGIMERDFQKWVQDHELETIAR